MTTTTNTATRSTKAAQISTSNFYFRRDGKNVLCKDAHISAFVDGSGELRTVCNDNIASVAKDMKFIVLTRKTSVMYKVTKVVVNDDNVAAKTHVVMSIKGFEKNSKVMRLEQIVNAWGIYTRLELT